AIHDELGRKEYLTVLPVGDGALRALGVPVEHLLDKARLLPLAESVGLRVPPTQVFQTTDELVSVAAGLQYPLIAKPARGKPARRYDRPAALIAAVRERHESFL